MDNFEREQLMKQYLEDPYIKSLLAEIEEIYKNNIPLTVINDEHGVLFVYEPKIDFRLKEVQGKIFDHIDKNYSELISTVRII